MSAVTVQRISGLLGALAYHVERMELTPAVLEDAHRLWASADGTATRVSRSGGKVFERLMKSLRESDQATKWWGEESLDNYVSTAAYRLATGASPSEAATELAKMIDTPPKKQTAILSVHGIRPQGVLDLCGISLVRDSPTALMDRTFC